MSTFVVKILAMTVMFGDHLSHIIYNYNREMAIACNCIGRIAMFLFCFQVVLGYKNTRNIKKYMSRMLIFAVISQPIYIVYKKYTGFSPELNVIFTLFFGLTCLCILNAHKTENGKMIFSEKKDIIKEPIGNIIKKIVAITLICLIIYIVDEIYGIDYGYPAVLLIIAMYIFYPFNKKYEIIKRIIYCICILIFSIYETFSAFEVKDFSEINDKGYACLFGLFCIIGGLITFLYNGKKGPNIKWITYLFYPLHLVILIFIYLITIK